MIAVLWVRIVLLFLFTISCHIVFGCDNQCKDALHTSNDGCAIFKQKGLCDLPLLAIKLCPCTCNVCTQLPKNNAKIKGDESKDWAEASRKLLQQSDFQAGNGSQSEQNYAGENLNQIEMVQAASTINASALNENLVSNGQVVQENEYSNVNDQRTYDNYVAAQLSILPATEEVLNQEEKLVDSTQVVNKFQEGSRQDVVPQQQEKTTDNNNVNNTYYFSSDSNSEKNIESTYDSTVGHTSNKLQQPQNLSGAESEPAKIPYSNSPSVEISPTLQQKFNGTQQEPDHVNNQSQSQVVQQMSMKTDQTSQETIHSNGSASDTLSELKAATNVDKLDQTKFEAQSSSKCGKNRPNFLVIMTDDQGHDDIGFYNWNHVLKTPNMDNLARQSVQFENFYTDSLCAPTRASLLTGRHHLKTGVWGVHGAMDYINLDETIIAQALKQAGYSTIHLGKWHSGTTPGYNAWDRGFDLSYTTKLYTFFNTVVKKNGWDTYTQGWVEDWLADRIVEYLQKRAQDGNPFFMLWTPMSVHKGRKWDSEWYEDFVAPERYYNKYWGKVSRDLVHVFAMLEYFDSVLGKVIYNLDKVGLGDDTVVMFFGDNGPHLYQTDHEHGGNRYNRVPSQMAEQKGFIEENGVRNFFFVRGPGFPAGRKVYQNVGVIDIYPTILELAGASPPSWNKPLDGASFAPLLCQGGTWAHSDRTLYFHEVLKNTLGSDQIFNLDKNRNTDRYQQMLKFYGGGQWGAGFQYSSGLKWKQWKYIKTDLYDLDAQNHQEYDWTKFSRTDWKKARRISEQLKQRLNDWWWSILAEPGAFRKPTFLIGREQDSPVKAIGAIERKMHYVQIQDQVAKGFKNRGDYLICRVRVVQEGNYRVNLVFGWTGYRGAHIKISVGKNWQLWSGKAPSVQRKLDRDGVLNFGNIYLPATGSNSDDEMLIQLVGRDWNDGSDVFWWLDSVQFIKQ